MKALRYHGRGDLRLDDIDESICGKDQVKLKPEYVGICGTGMIRWGCFWSTIMGGVLCQQALLRGTDLNEYLNGPFIIPTTAHPLTGEKMPITLGHEISATVVEVGSEIRDIQIGDKVAVFPLLADFTCGSCLRGRANCCASFGSIGFSGAGGLSQCIVTSRDSVLKLPANVTLEEGALAEPLTVAWHAVSQSPFEAGDDVLVVGAGPIGLAVIQVLKARGAGKILISEPSSRRQELARHFGADTILESKAPDAIQVCKAVCGGEGPGLVFDAAGVQPGLDMALAASRTGATIVNIATWKTRPLICSQALTMGEKKYIGTMVYLKDDFEHVIEAMGSGTLRPTPMITDVVALDEAIEKGFKRLLADKDQMVKVLIKV